MLLSLSLNSCSPWILTGYERNRGERILHTHPHTHANTYTPIPMNKLIAFLSCVAGSLKKKLHLNANLSFSWGLPPKVSVETRREIKTRISKMAGGGGIALLLKWSVLLP